MDSDKFDEWIEHLENLTHPINKSREIIDIVKYLKLKKNERVNAVGTEQCNVTVATYTT